MNYTSYNDKVYPHLKQHFDTVFGKDVFGSLYIEHINPKASIRDTFNKKAHVFLTGYCMARALVLKGDASYKILQDELFMAFEHWALDEKPSYLKDSKNGDKGFNPDAIQADVDEALDEYLIKPHKAKNSLEDNSLEDNPGNDLAA